MQSHAMMHSQTLATGQPASHQSSGAERLLRAIGLAEGQLAAELEVLNGLNVFPVPDGDTGTNMLATVRDAFRAAKDARTLGDASRSLAIGAMMGARGNSGVILAQFFRAAQEVLQTAPDFTLVEFERILPRAAELARRAVTAPVEGTMLTVMEAAGAAVSGQWTVDSGQTRRGHLRRKGDSSGDTNVMTSILHAVTEALARTPEQLPILHEAQVVDSGGYGFLLFLHGCYEGLIGGPAPPPHCTLLGLSRVREQVALGSAHPADLVAAGPVAYGYCITLLVNEANVDERHVRGRLEKIGNSVLVAAADGRLKLHIHASDPQAVLALARQFGKVGETEISNIDEQVARTPTPTDAESSTARVVAVVLGEGLAKVFRGLGAVTVPGGPGRNPSTAELLGGVGRVRSGKERIFLLPNNANVLPVAHQAASMQPDIVVIPTRSVPQGVAALLAFTPGAPDATNRERMTAAASGVVSAELVTAVREASLSGVSVKPGQPMAFLEGELVSAGEDAVALLLERAKAPHRELATVYYGAKESLNQADALRQQIKALAPNLEIELVAGGQPHARYIISFE